MSDSATPPHHVLDADPMAHFPSEQMTEEQAAEHDPRASVDTAVERDSLSAFISEEPAPIARPATSDRRGTARIRAVRVRAVTAARAAAVIVIASARNSRLYVAVAAERCWTWWRATVVQAQGSLLVVLVLAGGVCSACRRGLAGTTHRCRAASQRIPAVASSLPAFLSAAARILPRLPRASQHAYPAALFLSGVVVGASFVAVVRWPPARMVTPAAASKAPIESPAATEPSPAPAASVTAPDQPDTGHPVATNGTRTAPARQRVTSAAEENPSSLPGPYRGSLVINSRPEGADVFLNGLRVGTTPIVLDGLPVGSRAVRIVRDGHEAWSRALDVVANQRTTVVATLERDRRN